MCDVEISLFSANLYLIKPKAELSLDEIKELDEVRKLVAGKKVEFRHYDHGIWILHIL